MEPDASRAGLGVDFRLAGTASEADPAVDEIVVFDSREVEITLDAHRSGVRLAEDIDIEAR